MLFRSALLAKEAQKFKAEVVLALDGREVDGKSVLDILTLAATQGAHMQIKVTGEDAGEAAQQLEKVFKQGLGGG